jgi:proline iminopeptidase
MKIKVSGSRLYFDVEGVAYDARGEVAAERPTLILLHGSPGNSDHTVFKRYFHELTDVAQVIYLTSSPTSARSHVRPWCSRARTIR